MLVVGLLVVTLAGIGLQLRGRWEVEHTMLATTQHSTTELAGEFRLLQLTDFHAIRDRAQVDSIIALARSAEADVIALTGDLINTYNPDLLPVEQLVDGLAALGVPIYFIDGNHDHWSADHARLHAVLRERGVTLLDDEHRILTGDWGQVALIGVDDYFTRHGDLPAAVAGLPADGFRLVLTHSPEIFDSLAANGVDYAVCGHTHGGQIRLPFDIALYSPGGQFFPKLSKGRYTDGDATLFIDSGIGVTGPPYRLFNQSQITLHVLGPGA